MKRQPSKHAATKFVEEDNCVASSRVRDLQSSSDDESDRDSDIEFVESNENSPSPTTTSHKSPNGSTKSNLPGKIVARRQSTRIREQQHQQRRVSVADEDEDLEPVPKKPKLLGKSNQKNPVNAPPKPKAKGSAKAASTNSQQSKKSAPPKQKRTTNPKNASAQAGAGTSKQTKPHAVDHGIKPRCELTKFILEQFTHFRKDAQFKNRYTALCLLCIEHNRGDRDLVQPTHFVRGNSSNLKSH